MALDLKDIYPEKPEFSLKKTGKTYALKIPDLMDQIWFKERFGSEDTIQRVFGELRWPDICRIIYRLLSDRSDFVARSATGINDEGVESTIQLTGPEVLLTQIADEDEGLRMLAALSRSITLGNPLAAKAVGEELKKKIPGLQIGDAFSINSAPSTGGQRSISARVRSEKSRGAAKRSIKGKTKRRA